MAMKTPFYGKGGPTDKGGRMGKGMPGQAPPGPAAPGPAAPGLPMPMQAVSQVLNALVQTHNNLALLCAAASLATYIPEARNLPGLSALHRANYEAAYHLTTAIGSARMILSGAPQPGYYALLYNCQREVWEAMQNAMDAYDQLSQATPQNLRPWAQQVGGLLQATIGSLQRAVSLTTAALGPQGVQQLQQFIQQAGAGASER